MTLHDFLYYSLSFTTGVAAGVLWDDDHKALAGLLFVLYLLYTFPLFK